MTGALETALDEARTRHHVEWHWVKGHAGHEMNERADELAREGIEVERAPRPVTVYRFDVAPTDDPLVYEVEVHCSKGTYVRTLADDLGRLCGGGAHLRALRRTAVGGFTVATATSPDEVALLSIEEAVRDYPIVRVDEAAAVMVRNGRVLDRTRCEGFDGDGPWAVMSTGGELLAMYEAHRGNEVKPAVVIPYDGEAPSEHLR